MEATAIVVLTTKKMEEKEAFPIKDLMQIKKLQKKNGCALTNTMCSRSLRSVSNSMVYHCMPTEKYIIPWIERTVFSTYDVSQAESAMGFLKAYA